MDFHWLVLDFKKNELFIHHVVKLHREFRWWWDARPSPRPAMFRWKTKNASIYTGRYHGCHSRTQRIICQYDGWCHVTSAWQVPEVWSMGPPCSLHFQHFSQMPSQVWEQGFLLKTSLTLRARFLDSLEQDWALKQHKFVLMPYLHSHQEL